MRMIMHLIWNWVSLRTTQVNWCVWMVINEAGGWDRGIPRIVCMRKRCTSIRRTSPLESEITVKSPCFFTNYPLSTYSEVENTAFLCPLSGPTWKFPLYLLFFPLLKTHYAYRYNHLHRSRSTKQDTMSTKCILLRITFSSFLLLSGTFLVYTNAFHCIAIHCNSKIDFMAGLKRVKSILFKSFCIAYQILDLQWAAFNVAHPKCEISMWVFWATLILEKRVWVNASSFHRW